MNRLLVKLAAAASLGAIAIAAPAAAEDAPAAAAAPVAAQEYRSGTYGGWGFNPADLDKTVKPGDDFFRYVNGKWDAAEVIPPQYPYSGVALGLRLQAERDVKAIVDEMAAGSYPAGSLEQRVSDLYKAYLDTAAINAAGLAPAKPFLDRIAGVQTRADLAHAFAATGIPAPLGMYVSIDTASPNNNALYTGVGGIGLPDRDYYLVDSEANQAIRAKYKEYLAFLLGKAGYADPAATAERVYGLEKQFAALGWDRALSRNPELTTNRVTIDELKGMSGEFPVELMLQDRQVANLPALYVAQLPPTAEEIAKLGLTPEQLGKLGGGMPAMLSLLNTAPLEDIKAWMAARFLSGASQVLPSDIDDANFEFYGKTLQGKTQQRERWQRGLDFVQGAMGEGLGKIYVERHFPASSKAEMEKLVGNLRLALASNLKELEWMTPATRVAAQRKLDAFGVKIGYPEKFETYEGLNVVPGQALASAIAVSDWSWQEQLEDLAEPVDKTKWLMTPQTVNAYYMPPANEIVFPAAYLQPPYFNPKADAAVNYGAVGATIGHEIGHGFDDSGAKYGPTGALENWWTDEDRKTFEALGNKLVAQYDKQCPFDDGTTCHNGRLTLGENIGDLGGLSMAYNAYKLSLNGKPAPVIDGLTGDQRFFLSYAQAWRWKYREAFAKQLLKTDSHSLAEARVNAVLRNFDPWYAAFGVKPGDALYLAPADRVRIW
ncbi:M13 family metallopeptidase [Altererythrobacter sp. TH136]|uniref:M13 family metallopeptidase n=1 Tax=Altererythrobacter sp. TH136 TaxID=2067415 RepID=UPI0011653054|nr:M13 family metallopeptidase [Altererythrobacter sp. TH136]QDM40943.1 M13 family metallopeptidase [Altererythrobacter sp. TH136]